MTVGLLKQIADRLAYARAKHPIFAEGKYHALGVIASEFREFEHAVTSETPQRARDEALDVIATCVRFISGEHEGEHEGANEGEHEKDLP